MISQLEFLAKYKIEGADFNSTGLLWDDLSLIYEDHCKNIGALETTGNYISERLRKTHGVHSVKQRIKDPEHLVEKIIRKIISNAEREINLGNYKTEITDLIGIRALHLFKSDWLGIHDFIIKTWGLKEKPTANLRDGDPKEVISVFEDKECDIKRHPFGYRSVHYLVKSSPTKEEYISEVQVRTIFEEGWSEIDHQIRYPNHTDDKILSQFLVVFNRLAGSADEMGSYIQFLKQALEEREQLHQAEISDKAALINKLVKEINDLKIDTKKKQELQKDINYISSYTRPLPAQNLAKDFLQKVEKQINALNANWTEVDGYKSKEVNDVFRDYKNEYEQNGFIKLQGFWESDSGFDGNLSELKPSNTFSVKVSNVGTRESVFVLFDKEGKPIGMIPNNSKSDMNGFMSAMFRVFKGQEFRVEITNLDKRSKNATRQYFRCKTV